MIKHLLITSYYYHPIKSLNVTVKSHVYSKFSNSVSDRKHYNIYREDDKNQEDVNCKSIYNNIYI